MILSLIKLNLKQNLKILFLSNFCLNLNIFIGLSTGATPLFFFGTITQNKAILLSGFDNYSIVDFSPNGFISTNLLKLKRIIGQAFFLVIDPFFFLLAILYLKN
jgi:hypothetical protein